MNNLILNLLSGVIGALIGSIIIVSYTEYRDNKQEKKRIAKEKLEKVYGPLIALKKKIDLRNKNDGGFLLPSNPMEVEMIEKIIFHYYHLIEDDLKEDLVLLHSDLRNDITNQIKFPKMMDKIKKHYDENKKFLGIR